MLNAALYHSFNGQSRRDAKQVMDKYAKVMQWRSDGSDSLIDIGSGTGDVLMDYVYPLMPTKFDKVVCTDISEKMVNYASKNYAGLQGTQFQVLDIGKELPKQLHGSFDHVISFYCLQWVQNQQKVLSNINKLLRDEGGDCLLVFLVQCFTFDVYKLLAKNSKWSQYMLDYQQFISPFQQSSDPVVEYTQLLKEAGFVDQQVEIQHKAYGYEGLQNMRDLIKSICPFFERMPVSEHEAYLDDFLDIMVNMNLRQPMENSDDYRFDFTYKLMVAYARKAAQK